MILIVNKILFRIKIFLYLRILYNTPIYYWFYKSYIISKIFKKKKSSKRKNYLTIITNPGAEISHQLANYNSAIWFSKKFMLNHAHSDFSTKKWNYYFKFNYTSKTFKKLLNKGYKKIILPRFDEKKKNQIMIIKKIIDFYDNQRVVFVLEYDQQYKKQYETLKVLRKKFFFKKRKPSNLIYDKINVNIAIHIRLGDILLTKKNQKKRLLSKNYYTKAIKQISKIKTPKKKMFYIFSNGDSKYYKDLLKYKNIIDVKNLSDIQTFDHFIYSDILILSKSSFSYKAGLISNNLKIAPNNFWHTYPKNKKWIIINET